MKRLAGLVGVSCLVACRVAGADETELARLDEARSLWESVQSGDYRYSYRKYCECNREEPPITVVSVSNGEVDRVYHLHGDSEREVPARDGSLTFYWTVAELFDKLAGAYTREATVRVEYDPDLGFPRRLFIDYDSSFTGDETDLHVTRVELR